MHMEMQNTTSSLMYIAVLDAKHCLLQNLILHGFRLSSKDLQEWRMRREEINQTEFHNLKLCIP